MEKKKMTTITNLNIKIWFQQTLNFIAVVLYKQKWQEL